MTQIPTDPDECERMAKIWYETVRRYYSSLHELIGVDMKAWDEVEEVTRQDLIQLCKHFIREYANGKVDFEESRRVEQDA